MQGLNTVCQFTRIECGMCQWQNITDNLSLRQFFVILGYFGKNMVAMAKSLRPMPSEMSSSDLRTTKPPVISNQILAISRRYAFIAILVPKLVAMVAPLCPLCTTVSHMNSLIAKSLYRNQTLQ